MNARSGLYGPGKSLITRLIRDGAKEVIDLAVQRMRAMPWAVCRVRRRYNAPAIAPRSVQKLMIGGRAEMKAVFEEISHYSGIPLVSRERVKGAPKRSGDLDTYRRLWVQRREEQVYPSLEEFCILAPAQDKAQPWFEEVWQEIVTDTVAERQRVLGCAVKVVAAIGGDRRVRDRAGALAAAA